MLDIMPTRSGVVNYSNDLRWEAERSGSTADRPMQPVVSPHQH
jgi:hypothetical protein